MNPWTEMDPPLPPSPPPPPTTSIINPYDPKTEIVQLYLCSCFRLNTAIRNLLPPHTDLALGVFIRSAMYLDVSTLSGTGIVSYMSQFERQYLHVY